ncbi:MFS transporter [Actinacidiphila yeochonensis]|uniref:MFS transporter n=1 Tax=Actinacidiphila yeochonensis TaxID=89050 RepID=UPI00055B18B9|nr:MFS transporter [Actinacidiphila yeochonensis]
MLWINLIDKTGSGLWLSVTALYFVVAAGLGTGQVGLLLGLGGAAGIAGAPLAGLLADRLPLVRLLLAVQTLRAAASLLLLAAHGFWPLLALTAAGSLGERAASVLTKLFAARVAGPERARYQAVQRTVVNLGYTIGGLGASVALAAGSTTVYRVLLLGDGLSFVLVALLVAACTEPAAPTTTLVVRTAAGRPAHGPGGQDPGARDPGGPSAPAHVLPDRAAGAARGASPWRDRDYLAYAGLDAVAFLYSSALGVGLPLWVITRTSAPHGLAAATFVINTVIVVALQVRLARHADGPRAAADALRFSALWSALGGAAAAAAALPPVWAAATAVVGAAVALTVVEMVQSASTWELSVSLAPPHAQGRYVGVHALLQAVSRSVGPLLLTSVVLPAGAVGWLGLGAALTGTALLQRRLVLRRVSAPDVPPDPAGAALSVAPATFGE